MSEVTARSEPEAANMPPEVEDEQPVEEDERPVEPDRRAAWRESMRVGLWTWLAGLVMYALVTSVAWLPGAGQAPNLPQAYQAWNRWDTVWYVIIADSGYRYDSRSAAFFPLYPLLVRFANRVLPGGTFEAALLLSILFCLVALVLVHRLTTELIGPELGRRTTFYLFAFPTGFYLAAAYNESLFIALAAGSLYCMRRRHWWLAAVLAGFASATRMAGALLALAFLYEYLRQRGFALRRIRWDVLWVALTPGGLLLYALYCARTFGDPLYFEKMQANWFHTGFQAPWTTLGQVFELATRTHPVLGADSMRNIINLTTAVGVLILLVVALDRHWGLGREQAYLVVFSAGIVLMPLLNPIRTYYPLSSMWRFALECLPVFMVLAKMGRNARFDRVYTMVALAVQGVMIVTFLQNQFVA
ncbi:MAG TPA: mannosyltransferase family protein [Rugosimonospora sp.]|nr:mannosyltransferase family protein [Rugosimonospora sp.]